MLGFYVIAGAPVADNAPQETGVGVTHGIVQFLVNVGTLLNR